MSFLSRRPLRHFLLTGSVVVLTVLPTALGAQTLSDTSWTEYFGSSHGPHQNWGHTSRVGSSRTGQIKSALKRGDDVLLGDSYGLGSARKETAVAKFMNSIEADGGQSFRRTIFDRALALHQIQLNLGVANQELYLQFGNEITSVKYALNLRSWAKQPVQPTRASDPFIIPYYVEYYLAPGVEAIREAEIATGTFIPVLLGSIGNANAQVRRNFLYALLNYEVIGTYASTLAGQRVADIIDYIDIHYMIAKNTHVVDTRGKNIKHLQGSFKLALNEIYDPWVATGIVDGLWTSEEVGRKVASGGYGAAKAMVVTARYLHWWGENNVSSAQAQTLLFGTTLGPSSVSADLAMQTLFNFLGATPLSEIPVAIVPPANDWETYLFESVNDANKRVGFVVPSWSDTVSNTFTQFQVDATNWPGTVSAEVYVFGLGATSSSIATVDRQNDILTVTVPTPIVAQTNRPPSIVILLQRN